MQQDRGLFCRERSPLPGKLRLVSGWRTRPGTPGPASSWDPPRGHLQVGQGDVSAGTPFAGLDDDAVDVVVHLEGQHLEAVSRAQRLVLGDVGEKAAGVVLDALDLEREGEVLLEPVQPVALVPLFDLAAERNRVGIPAGVVGTAHDGAS